MSITILKVSLFPVLMPLIQKNETVSTKIHSIMNVII